ncbi:HDOD domain-containing protein [Imhoffiella purpurea]|uniref:GAF-domain containing protein n=1 Tax=Imhoffiella purpurea TaxID=1249627 RepID=W9VFA1_9GAMM|nr:HDOD domain-containing protein [Imhoffiella purpurea]EXJ15681.1 GAF-domain containing protein [Imhoffiella purpurea]
MSTRQKHQTKLEEWMELIRRQNMPIFDSTARRIIAISRDDTAPMSDLAGIILNDPSFTARVLKLANSIYYNPTSTVISTITRAVIVLGINAVSNICVTLALVDATMQGAAKQRFGRELGRSMHAAVQARALAIARGDKSPEEIFIATLLYNIGDLAFWCFGGELAEQLDRLVTSTGMAPEMAQERLLGFRLSQLTRQLVSEWQLTELLQEAINNPKKKTDRILTLNLGQQIALCAEEKGWTSNDMDQLVRKASILVERSQHETRNLFFEKARAACSIANDYGAEFAATFIPQPLESEAEPETPEIPRSTTRSAATPASDQPVADHITQVKILRELTGLIAEERCDFNVVMELVLEGIYRGVGMDRVLFALTSPDKRVIKAKYALGADEDRLMKGFQFVRNPKAPTVLFLTLDRKLPRMVSTADQETVEGSIPENLARLTGIVPFMIAPIIVSNQCIGLIYADRGPSGRALDPTSFQDFKHFVHQANMGLTQARSRKGG